MIRWEQFFDKIYCLHYINDPERISRIQTELKRIGILDNKIFDWFYDYDSPFFKIIQKNSTSSPINSDICNDKNFSYFKCSFSHYRIWKEICVRNYKRTLIVEDDEVWLKDLNLLNDIINDIPLNADICMFDKITCHGLFPYINNIKNPIYKLSKYFHKFDSSLKLCSGGCYSITNNAAFEFSNLYEQQIIQCDNIWNTDWFEKTNLTKTFSIINTCHQVPYPNTNCSNVDFNLAYSWVMLNDSIYQKYE